MAKIQHLMQEARRLHLGGNLAAAGAAYIQALVLEPDNMIALANLGDIHIKSQQWLEAERLLKLALTVKRDEPELHFKLGAVLQAQNRLPEAVACYEQVLALKPAYPEVLSNLGVIAKEQDRNMDAIDFYRQAIRLKPELPETLHNLGLALHAQGEFVEAIQTYRDALVLEPDLPKTHLSLSMSLLTLGHYAEGWQEYEWRRVENKNGYQISPTQRWNGRTEDTPELILVEEQGIGDIIQFIRYCRLLKTVIPVVSLAVRESLVMLIAMTGLFDKIYSLPMTEPLIPAYSRWLPLMSLPGFIRVTREQPLVTGTYIVPPADYIQRWQEKISFDKRLTIGLNWQGNPEIEYNNFKGRSFPLSEYEPLAQIPGVQFVSLQKGYGSEQLEACTFKDRFVSCQDEISNAWDWVETAAIVQNCDLVITSDTSIAHLAGAMGKPVWILLKKIPEWRWGLQGENCPWYPSARLFRQTEDGHWAGVMQQVKSELSQWIQTGSEAP